MFENVIGYSSVKDELMKFYDIMTHPEYYKLFNAPLPKGIMLYGDPGVGKTLFATELINACNRNVFTIKKTSDGPIFLDYIKSQFEEAKNHQPAIIFLDDFDKFSADGRQGAPASEFAVIQSCIDETIGLDIFIIATANEIFLFPDSLLRPGRFDRLIHIKKPSSAEAVDIMGHYLMGKPIDQSVDVVSIAKILDGYSCATLESVINMASLYAGYDRSSTIKTSHIIEAILSVVFDKPKSNFQDDIKYREMVAYHEAGHAVVSEILCPGSTSLVTTRQTCEYDSVMTITSNKVKTTPEILNDIRILMGGKAATELKFGYCDAGTFGDINKSYNILYTLIGENAYKGFYYAVYGECTGDSELVNRCQGVLYQEAQKLYNDAAQIISDYWYFVEAIVRELLQKETLIYSDITNIKRAIGLIQ